MNIQDYLEENLHPSTAKNYLYEINKFRLLNRKTEDYNYQDVMEYVEELRKSYPPNTINRIVSAIKKYYDYLQETEQRSDNPARSIKLRDAKDNPIQLQDLFSEKELQKLLEPRIERYPFLTKKNQIIMSLLVYQALKSGEIIQLKTDDINLEKATIQIIGTGITNSRILPLKAQQILLLYEFINQDRNKLKTVRNDENALLLGKLGTPIQVDDIHYLISTYQKEFAKNLTTITIRQSVITNLLNKGNDLRMVQEFAGHKHLDTTEKYRQTGIKALQNAIDKHHPIK
ncbi:tyrosine-type recombinase/integrase [Flavobacterium restrictum]|uniref:Tyrosine-type recombinase/integrase n=1 Tax=Flavobacterium restrictum TaxID=2594428 RepID=A0A553DQ60_9FLAO|nr:tyrosine-type recombinase/integrase [Flavobacterium restrictum]TRX34918.1 tyrosine-type recombinase/integrase [Flavobacterium restrictum]